MVQSVRFADRLVGSPQIYAHKEREAEESVNFVTCHDGFTLNDLVSYNRKHNEANRENNRDGAEDNRSQNWGIEGPSDDPALDALRNRQVKNFLAVTMLALGLPMILMGDEVRRSQNGNNNAWCQDNETSWFDWTLLSKQADMHRFANRLSAHRLVCDLTPGRQQQTLNQLLREADRTWHGVKLGQPEWSLHSHSLACSVLCRNENLHFYLIFNAYWEPLQFELLPVTTSDGLWRRWIDTSLDSPDDIHEWQTAPVVTSGGYLAGPRSVVALFARTAAY
jgi:isoamylase